MSCSKTSGSSMNGKPANRLHQSSPKRLLRTGITRDTHPVRSKNKQKPVQTRHNLITHFKFKRVQYTRAFKQTNDTPPSISTYTRASTYTPAILYQQAYTPATLYPSNLHPRNLYPTQFIPANLYPHTTYTHDTHTQQTYTRAFQRTRDIHPRQRYASTHRLP